MKTILLDTMCSGKKISFNSGRLFIDSQFHPEPPAVTAIYLSSCWMIDGTEDNEIIEQAKKIIELNELIVRLNVAS